VKLKILERVPAHLLNLKPQRSERGKLFCTTGRNVGRCETSFDGGTNSSSYRLGFSKLLRRHGRDSSFTDGASGNRRGSDQLVCLLSVVFLHLILSCVVSAIILCIFSSLLFDVGNISKITYNNVSSFCGSFSVSLLSTSSIAIPVICAFVVAPQAVVGGRSSASSIFLSREMV